MLLQPRNGGCPKLRKADWNATGNGPTAVQLRIGAHEQHLMTAQGRRGGALGAQGRGEGVAALGMHLPHPHSAGTRR